MADFNILVQIMEQQSHASDYDPEPTDWKPVGVAWVRLIPTRAREQIEGQQLRDVVHSRMETRYTDTIQPGHRLESDDRQWEVHGVIDVDDQHEILELIVSSVERVENA